MLHQFVHFFTVFNTPCLISFRRPKYSSQEFSSQRLAVSEFYFLSAPMFLMHRSLLVLLLFCIISALNEYIWDKIHLFHSPACFDFCRSVMADSNKKTNVWPLKHILKTLFSSIINIIFVI